MGMETQPIKDLQLIEAMKKWLKARNYRDYFLFVLTINIGRRAGDMVRLKVKDVINKDVFKIKERKTGKENIEVILTSVIKKEIIKYCIDKDKNDYLFPSRKKLYGEINHISYERMNQIMNQMFDFFNTNNTGTHTLRKTFGYWYYRRTKNIEGLREMFGHATIEDTKRYIGLKLDEKKKYMRMFGGL